jgi:hypothetical protein
MARARRIWLAAALVATGCTLATEFWTMDDATPVVAFGPPEDYPRSAFGSVVVTGLFPEIDGSTYVAASAGTASPAESFHWATGAQLLSDSHLSSFCSPLSADVDDTDATLGTCENSGTGAALLWLDSFTFGSTLCAPTLLVGQPLAGETARGRIAMNCPTTGETVGILRAGSNRLGRALALVRRGGGEVLAAGLQAGVVLTLGPPAPGVGFADVTVGGGLATEAFGGTLAAGEFEVAGGGFLAVGASTRALTTPQPSRMFLVDPDSARAVYCEYEASATALGSSLLASDLTGDGDDELLYVDGSGAVHMADGAAIRGLMGGPVAPSCSATPLTAAYASLVCPAPGDFGVRCSASFGASLGVGDLDADGAPEILVGDPEATVEGVARAGAVHVYELEAGTWVASAALFDASPGEGQRMGSAISVVKVGNRDEPFVGAEGSGEVFAFYCSGLAGDKPYGNDLAHAGRKLSDRCLEPQ